jgi:chemotaxis receptor (MCP) glutamine deamidase CheD
MNAETAIRVLKEEGFRVLASRLGGSRGIFIEFDTGTGEVLLRRLARMNGSALART